MDGGRREVGRGMNKVRSDKGKRRDEAREGGMNRRRKHDYH